MLKEPERTAILGSPEPLRFIFSHSALREGWDNPNVFQICTLNQARSAMKKRQEIGRGLRLPVNQHGLRVFDEAINKLFVMANDSYDDFARALQTEYEEDRGVTLGKVPITAIAKLTRVVDEEPQPIGRQDAETIKKALVEPLSDLLPQAITVTQPHGPSTGTRLGAVGQPPAFFEPGRVHSIRLKACAE